MSTKNITQRGLKGVETEIPTIDIIMRSFDPHNEEEEDIDILEEIMKYSYDGEIDPGGISPWF